MGVITRKKTADITTGEIIAPKNIPNLNHNLLNGVRIFEFINPKIRKNEEINIDQSLMGSPYVKGQIVMIKKTMKNTIPKLLFELIFILFIDFIALIFS